MKKFLPFLLLLPVIGYGQARFDHFDIIELDKIKKTETERIAKMPLSQSKTAVNVDETPLTLFMRVSDDATVERIEAAGAEVTLRAGNIIIVETTLGKAESLAATEGVVTVSLPEELKMDEFTSNVGIDLSRQWLGLDKMHAGTAPLPKAYSGEGVIVGILDGGIDPNHIMFDDEEGNPRVKRIINHVQVGNNKLTQRKEKPEDIRSFKTDADANTHGTHVMGLVAGSYNAGPDGPDFSGGAPKAEIAVKCGATDNARLIQGLKYITDYAREEGKPCVINISLGSNKGPHDGTDEFPAALQEYAKMDGVTICVSAGNEGADQAFLYHEFGEDSTPMKTFIAPSAYTDQLYSQVTMLPMFPQAIGQLEIWSDDETPFDVYFDYYDVTKQPEEAVFSFKLDPFTTSYLSSTGSSPVTGTDVLVVDNADFNSHYLNSFVGGNSSIYPANNRFYSELNFQLECPDQAAYQSGFMSIRVVPGKAGQKIYVYGLPMSGYFGFSLLSGGYESLGFSGSYANGSINAMAGAQDVITVGSYITHNFNKDIAPQYTIGTTSNFSSWGTTPDGRLHPLISAPGNFIVSSMSRYYYNLLGEEDANDERVVYYRAKDKKNTEHYWTIMSGTSMASPYMAGIAAAWLSADPTLSTADILRIAQETASAPVEPSENDGSGYLVDAYAGLCKILNLSGINNVSTADVAYSVERNGNVFTVLAPSADGIAAGLYNLGGTCVAEAAADGQELTVDASSLAPGIYVMTVRAGSTVGSEKIVVK